MHARFTSLGGQTVTEKLIRSNAGPKSVILDLENGGVEVGRLVEAETYVHDVLNVFMCTGFTRDTGQYFMKSSPVRPGDYLEFYAEIDLLVGLSACPGGDCSSEHSSDTAKCHPLHIEVWDPGEKARKKHQVPQLNPYSQNHGIG